jgi:hypothetical protein
MQNKEKERGDTGNILLRKGRNNAWVLFCSKHGRKEDRKHAARSKEEEGMDVILQNKGKEESRDNLQQTRKEGIEERRPSAE